MSGRPGRLWLCNRYLYPSAYSKRRRISSGAVFLLRILRMLLLRRSDEILSILNSWVRDRPNKGAAEPRKSTCTRFFVRLRQLLEHKLPRATDRGCSDLYSTVGEQ